MTTATVQTIDTPDGPFTIVADEAGHVVASGWTADTDVVAGRVAPAYRPASLRVGGTDAATAVAAFYNGDLDAIAEVPVIQHGTAMQRAGWEALRQIAPGEPLTYTTFAAMLGHPGAVRAAASICARNAPALFVPCHRVLRSDGSMGGFAWGVAVKQRLLDREAQNSLLRV